MQLLFNFIISLAFFCAGLFGFSEKPWGSDATSTMSAHTRAFNLGVKSFYLVKLFCLIAILSIATAAIGAQYGALFAVGLLLALSALLAPKVSFSLRVANTGTYDASERAGLVKDYPVAAATKLFTGNLGALDASGNVVAAGDISGIRVIGRIEADVDNSAGNAGDLTVRIKRGVFRYTNSSGSPVTAAYIGKKVYVENDYTIGISGGTNKIVAGRCVDIETGFVWIDTRLANAGAVPAATASAVVTTGATNSTPYGYSQAQADAIVAQGNANRVDIAAILTYLGL